MAKENRPRPCPHCASTATQEHAARIALDYRAYRCPAYRQRCNEHTGTSFNHLELPATIVLLTVVWHAHSNLSLRDVAELVTLTGMWVLSHSRCILESAMQRGARAP